MGACVRACVRACVCVCYCNIFFYEMEGDFRQVLECSHDLSELKCGGT